MGIYGVKSKTCNCRGYWSTWDKNDYRIYMRNPCEKHSLKVGNTIYYKLNYLLKHISNKDVTSLPLVKAELPLVKETYLVKILHVEQLTNFKMLIKIEVKHNGELNVDNFNNNKQIFYSQINDEPMWKKIDDNIIHMITLYQEPHHTVEEDAWEPWDY
jgi:hypothetical protein